MTTGKRFVLATLAAFFVMFALAGVFNQILIKDFVRNNIASSILRETPVTSSIVLGYLLLSVFMSYLYPIFARPGQSTLVQGVKFGALMGLLWMFPFNLVLHGNYNFPAVALLIDTGWALLEQGLGGVVIALVYGSTVQSN